MGQPACLENMTSVKERDCPTQRSWAFKIGPSKLLLALHAIDPIIETIKIPQDHINLDLMKILLGFLRLLKLLKLTLYDLCKKTWIRSSKQLSQPKHQKKTHLAINLKPSLLITIAVSSILSTITSVNNKRTTLPLLDLSDEPKFCLQLLFFGIKSTSISSSTS